MELRAWINGLGLEKYVEVFVENEIDMEAARDLTEDDLKELGLPMGPRKKLLRAISELDDLKHSSDVDGSLELRTDDAGERRQVTVLFADISDFTNLSAEIDAEEIHALLETYFEEVDDIIRRHGGTVDKHIGDSVMAVFGAPVAYGNEAERALGSALAIHASMPLVGERVGRPLQAHIGVASGQVVASAVGGDERFTVTGASVNLAARLTDFAKAGETIVAAGVRSAAGFAKAEFGPAELLEVKGFDRPIEAYLVADAVPSETPNAPQRQLIGRAREMAQFQVALDDCLNTGAGQMVYLRGEAGIGKTRLATELAAIAVQEGLQAHRTLVLDFGLARGQEVPRALARSLLGLDNDADDAARIAAAHTTMDTGLIAPDDAMHLHELLDLAQASELSALYDAMDAERRRRGRRETLARLVVALAEQQPQFVLIEDVHWADAQVLDIIAEVVRRISEAPVMFVATTRIEGDPLQTLHRAGLGVTAATTLDLRGLRSEEAARLADSYEGATQDYVDLCIERAEGNPLFLEQLLRNAATAVANAVPDSVQSLVQARMDALPVVDRDALQAASVMGQRFSLEELRHLLGAPDYDPSELVARHLVQPDGEQYLFSHALVRDSVYDSILRSKVRQLHHRAADAIGSADLALRARHLDLAEAPEAATVLLEAAQSAFTALDDDSTLSLAHRGLELSDDAALAGVFMRLRGDALRNLGRTDESIEVFDAASKSAEGADDLCLALVGLAEGLRVADRHEDALAVLERADAVAGGMPALTRARIHYLRGSVSFPMGDIDQCLAGHELSLTLAQESGSPAAEASALSGLGDAYYLQGLMQDARERFDACVTISRAHGLGRIEVANRHMVGWSRIYMMEFRGAFLDGIECAEMAARVGNRRAEQAGQLMAGFAQYLCYELDAAEEIIRRGFALSETIGTAGFSINHLTVLAQVLRDQNKLEDARRVANEAVERLARVGMTFVGPYTLAVAASVEPDLEKHRALIKQAEAVLDAGCVSHNYFWFAHVAIDAELAIGNWASAQRHATRLAAYTAQRQPLAWSDFIISRANALIALEQGQNSAGLRKRVTSLAQQATEAGLTHVGSALMEVLQA